MNKSSFFLALLFITAFIACNNENEQNTTKENELTLIAGSGKAGFQDGTQAKLFKPIRLSAYKGNSIIFADINNHAIRVVDENGNVKTIAGGPEKEGFADGNADTAKFKSPHGVAYNAKTNKIYVASASNHVIREISENEDGKFIVTTVAGIPGQAGFKDGSADTALFNSPHGVLVRKDGALVVIDIGNAKLRLIKDGIVSTLAGKEDSDALKAGFYYPIDIALEGDNILVADAGNHKIFRVKPDVSVETVMIKDTIDTPHGITVDDKGIIYIAEMGKNRILSINKQGVVNTVIDVPADSTNVNNLKKPAAVLYDKGFLWIADLNNHQIKRLKIE